MNDALKLKDIQKFCTIVDENTSNLGARIFKLDKKREKVIVERLIQNLNKQKEETMRDPVLCDSPEHILHIYLSLDAVYKKLYTSLPIDAWALRLQATISKKHKKASEEWSGKLESILNQLEKLSFETDSAVKS
jgi:hypothetical protein